MKRLFSIILASLLAATATAQTIQVQCPAVVAADEQFNITFIVEGDKPSDFDWQIPPELRLIWGPQRGSSTSMSMINGKTTKSVQTTSTYMLMPLKEGEFVFDGATATIKGKKVQSPQIKLKVAARGAASDDNAEDLFIRLELSKNSVVVGESIEAAIKLYFKVDVEGYEDARFPTFDGFWNQAHENQNQNPTREMVGDQIYTVATLRSYTLIPQQSGEIVIDPAELVCRVRTRKQRPSANILDSFFETDYSITRKRLATKATKLHVSALPSPQPESFCGGVGRFAMTAALGRDSLQAHEASSIVVSVSGKGNLALVEAPKVKFPPDFETYDVKVSEKNGAKVYEYPFIAHQSGNFNLGPVEFAYYDLDSRQYRVSRSDTLRLRVSKAPVVDMGGAPQSGFTGASGRDVRNIGSDIRYVKTSAPDLVPAGHFFVLTPAFLVLIFIILALGVVACFVVKSLRKRRGDVVSVRKRTASKMARKRLAKAGEYLDSDLHAAFYDELHRALLGFVGDALNMEASEMDKESIASRLASCAVSADDVSALIALLDACEFARYAPSEGHGAMDAHYKTALELISAIDDDMKQKPKGAAAAVLALLLLAAPSAFAAPAGSSSYGPAASSAASRDSLWTLGVEAYAAEDWEMARRAWEEIAESGYESADLYDNLACACFKCADLAHAILYYERALKIDPSHSDARYNLEYSRTFLKDKIEEVPEFFVLAWMRSVRNSVPSDTWAVVFLVLLALAVALFCMFMLSRRNSLRKLGFFGGIAAFVVSLCCLGFSVKGMAEYRNCSDAVVISSALVVRSAPDNNSGSDLFVLHEGTKVKVVDSVGDWLNIELADGRQGWVFGREVEKI